MFPAAGGKIMDLIHRPSGRNLLWHNPRIGLAATNPGASFDDVWCGGWDEIFPTDPPCADETNSYHDHGDLWIGPWSATPDGENALVLERASASLPCVMTKRLEVMGDAVHVSYRLVNTGYAAFDYMWDIHMAHAIRPGLADRGAGQPGVVPGGAVPRPHRPVRRRPDDRRRSRRGRSPNGCGRSRTTASSRSAIPTAAASRSPTTRPHSPTSGCGASTAAGAATTCC